MHFLVCVETDLTRGDRWAVNGEPVVPNLPTGYMNSFLGTSTFKPAIRAVVVNLDNIDIDEIAGSLKTQFPGLPPELFDTYVLETAKAAHAMRAGTVCQVYTSAESAQILDIQTNKAITLWTRQPLPGRIKQ